MAGKGTIGAKLVLEGESEYKSALKSIGQAQKELKSEMALCSAEFKNNQNSMEALTAKSEVLQKQYDAQAEKVKVYSDALAEAQDYQQKAQEAVDTYTEQLAKEQQALEDLKASGTATNEEIAEQEARVNEVAAALENANSQYTSAGEKVQQYQTSLNYAQAELANLDNQIQQNNQYMEEARNSADGCATSIDSMGKAIKQTEEDSSRFGDVLKANLASEAIVAGLEGLVGLIQKAGEELFEAGLNAAFYADNITTMSNNTGIARSTLQELTYAQELMDVSVETVTGSIAKNTKAMASAQAGSEKYAEAYEKLGINVMDAEGNLRNSEEVFWEVIDALGGMDNAAERDATAMQLLGRSAQSLNSLVKIGSSGFRELANEAQNAGFVMSESTLDSLVEVSDSWERMQNSITAVKNEIGAKVAPTLTKSFSTISKAVSDSSDNIANLADKIIPALAKGITWIIDNADIVLSVVAGLGAAFVAQSTVIPVVNTCMGLYTLLTEGATVAQEGLNTAMNMNPVLALVTGLIALTTAIGTYIGLSGDATEATTEAGKRSKELCDRNKELVDSIHDVDDAYDSNIASIAATADTASSLVDELDSLRLAFKDDGTAESAANLERQKQIIGTLNDMYPDLNAEINKKTGATKSDTDAIRKNIAAMQEQARQQAMQEYIKDKYQQLVDLKKEEFELNNDLSRQQKEMAENEAALDANRNNSVTFEADPYSAVEKIQNTEDYTTAIRENEEAIQNDTDALDENREAQAEVEANIQAMSEAITEESQLARENAQANGETANSYENLSEKAREYGQSIAETVENQISLFDKLDEAQKQSFATTEANLEANNKAVSEWLDNMEQLATMGFSDEVISELWEMGVNGAGYVQGLLDADAEQVKQLNAQIEERNRLITKAKEDSAKWADGELGMPEVSEDKAKEQGEKTAKAYSSGYGQALEHDPSFRAAHKEAIVTSSEDAKNEAETKGEEIGKSIDDSTAESIVSNKDVVDDAMETVGESAIETMKNTVSPEAMKTIGLDAAKGLAAGLQAGLNGIKLKAPSIETGGTVSGNNAGGSKKLSAPDMPAFNAYAEDYASMDTGSKSSMNPNRDMLDILNDMAKKETNVTVVLEGDAGGVFSLVQNQARLNRLRMGDSGL